MEEYLKAHERLGRLLKKDIVFVVGATRWGTSWVQQCLDTHPKINTIRMPSGSETVCSLPACRAMPPGSLSTTLNI
jgi:hypothetical protein